MTADNIYFCTRPRVASALMTAGIEGKRVANPYNTDYLAWTFPKTAEVMAIVNVYVPNAVRR